MKKILLIISIIIVTIYIFISLNLGNENKFSTLKKMISQETKYNIKYYLFPYKLIDELQTKLHFGLSPIQKRVRQDFKKKENSTDFKFVNLQKTIIIEDKNYTLRGFLSDNSISRGINNIFPGSGHLEFYDEKLFFVSAIGIFGFSKPKNSELKFKQIKNNIENFINEESLIKHQWFSVKDLSIFDNKVFVSYTNEIYKDCWNTTVLIANLNYEYLTFKKLFEPQECVYTESATKIESPKYKIDQNVDGEFNAHQSGGRIVKLDKNHVLLSMGEFRYRSYAQDLNRSFGKIIKLNINSGNYEIISYGHRNPQGLYFDKENNFVLTTEHGPRGGDEVNLIDLNFNKISNYGWPLASYGEHEAGGNWPGDVTEPALCEPETCKKKYNKYPLYKSHKDYGFIEPLTYFVPSIGISNIVGLGNKIYMFVSMARDKSLYTFRLNDNNELENLVRNEIGERIRDIIFNGKKIFLFLEDTATIGIIDYK
jgi:hypothetical protein